MCELIDTDVENGRTAVFRNLISNALSGISITRAALTQGAFRRYDYKGVIALVFMRTATAAAQGLFCATP